MAIGSVSGTSGNNIADYAPPPPRKERGDAPTDAAAVVHIDPNAARVDNPDSAKTSDYSRLARGGRRDADGDQDGA